MPRCLGGSAAAGARRRTFFYSLAGPNYFRSRRGPHPRPCCSAHTPSNGSRLSLADASHASRSRARVLAWPQALYLSRDDRETAIEDSWMGRLRNRTDSEEHTHHRLCGREDLEPGEPPARDLLARIVDD